MEVQNISFREFGTRLRQHGISLVTFHQDAPGHHHVDVVRLEEEQGVSLVEFYLHLLHDLDLPIQREAPEKWGGPKGLEDSWLMLLKPLAIVWLEVLVLGFC